MAALPLEQHVRYVGVLTLIWAGIGALAALIGILLVAFGFAFAVTPPPGLDPMTAAAAALSIVAAIVVFQFIAGLALLKGLTWGRPLTMVVAAFSLMQVPLGTAYGIYALWVLTRPGVHRVIHHRHRVTGSAAA